MIINVNVVELDISIENAPIESNIQIVVNDGPVGPAGPPGPPGGEVVTVEAGQNLSAARGVVINDDKAYYFQPTDPTHAGRFYGITASSASVGNDVDIQIGGEMVDVAFAFSPDSVLWVVEDGEITQTQPTGVILLQKAGISTGINKMKLDYSIQIKLN